MICTLEQLSVRVDLIASNIKKLWLAIIACTSFCVFLIMLSVTICYARITQAETECMKLYTEYCEIKHELGVWEQTNDMIVYMAQHDWEIDINDTSVRDVTWK